MAQPPAGDRAATAGAMRALLAQGSTLIVDLTNQLAARERMPTAREPARWLAPDLSPQPPNGGTTMRVVLFGTTGMVGQGVLHECLRDSRVTRVLAVGRRPTGVSHPKLERGGLHAHDVRPHPRRGHDARAGEPGDDLRLRIGAGHRRHRAQARDMGAGEGPHGEGAARAPVPCRVHVPPGRHPACRGRPVRDGEVPRVLRAARPRATAPPARACRPYRHHGGNRPCHVRRPARRLRAPFWRAGTSLRERGRAPVADHGRRRRRRVLRWGARSGTSRS